MVISLANAGNAPAPADKPAILKSSEF
ncbi:MAG: hypothetical protein QOJ26_1564, partial [Thermoplasmata archaeon]|nr:hypothetical protein [Thermoplasmata archaeon]